MEEQEYPVKSSLLYQIILSEPDIIYNIRNWILVPK